MVSDNHSVRSSNSRHSFGEEMIPVSNSSRVRAVLRKSASRGTPPTHEGGKMRTMESPAYSESSVDNELLVNMIPNSISTNQIDVKPSTLEVDYDKNITNLYQAITDSNWKGAVKAARETPDEAKTWVVRHYQEEEERMHNDHNKEPEIMWRFLPIHSASARQPPEGVISALLHAYPDGSRCVDDQGMFALHYACGNQASCEVIRLLLSSFPEAAHMHDPNGMLPLHYLACWGPSSMPVVDMVLVANRDAVNAKDAEGNTPLDLSLDGEYPDRDRVVSVLRQWASNVSDSRTLNQSGSSVSSIRFNTNKQTTISLVDHEEDENGQVELSPYGPREETREAEHKKTPHSILRMNLTPRDRESREREMTPRDNTPREDADAGSSSPSTPFLVSRLKEEISNLKGKLKESKWELQAQKSMESQAALKDKITQLERKVDRQQEEMELTKEEYEEITSDLEKKDEECLKLRKDLKEKDVKLKEALNERKGLRLTLTDLMEQHEKFKRKADTMNDRLGSLSASLASMIEQHKTVLRAMQEREENWRKASNERKQRYADLMAMESEQERDMSLEEALDRQNKEMEAIAAVIAVTRQ